MTRIIYSCLLVLLFAGISNAQSNEENKNIPLNREWKDAMKEVEKALEEIEIPDLDLDQIMVEVRQAMPTQEELKAYQEIVQDAMRELQQIDFTELEKTLEAVGRELKDIRVPDQHWEKSNDEKIYRQPGKNER